MIAAELEGVPYGRVHTSLTLVAPSSIDCEVFRSAREFEAQRIALFERFGITPEFHNFHTLSPWFNAVFATPELVGYGPLPPRTILAGPSIVPRAHRDAPVFDWSVLDPDRPLAYVSFGTVVAPAESLLRNITTVLVEHGMQVVMRTGDLPYEPDQTQANAFVVKHAPQLQALEAASLFVTHGGANSVMESLYSGVPMLVVPHTFEQPVQAHFVTMAGAGLGRDPAHLDLAACREAISELVQTPAFRVRARRIQEAYRRSDGARLVAEKLAGLA
jgi:zeaxanthin glucosyltransferase